MSALGHTSFTLLQGRDKKFDLIFRTSSFASDGKDGTRMGRTGTLYTHGKDGYTHGKDGTRVHYTYGKDGYTHGKDGTRVHLSLIHI